MRPETVVKAEAASWVELGGLCGAGTGRRKPWATAARLRMQRLALTMVLSFGGRERGEERWRGEIRMRSVVQSAAAHTQADDKKAFTT
jgi:hypothetical protein